MCEVAVTLISRIVNRRKALKGIGVGASAGLFLPTLLTSCKEDDPGGSTIDYDGTILIVGAGAAGLYVADLLMEKGLNVTVLEASERIGGRILSVRGVTDFPVELGADTIKTEESLLLKVTSGLNLNVSDLAAGRENLFYLNGQIKSAGEWATDASFAAAQHFVSNPPFSDNTDQTILQAIQEAGLSSDTYLILESQLGDQLGSDNNRISISGVKGSLNLPTNSKSLALANNPLQDILFSRFSKVLDHIQYSTKVLSIDYSGEEISIVTNNGNLTANKVVLTVPVSIIKRGDVNFIPALPDDKLQALNRMGMDGAMKMMLKFNRNFWGQATYKIFGGELIPVYEGAGAVKSTTNRTLIATAFGSEAEALTGLNDEEIKARLIAELDAMFDGNASTNNELNAFIKKDWSADENIRGGYSYPLPGGSNNDRIVFSAPVQDKLYFAGEAANVNGNYGTVHGALESAAKTAQEIIDSILAE